MNKECINCKQIFETNKLKKIYCNRNCYVNKKIKKYKECSSCNNKFEVMYKNQVYCNITCYSKSDKLSKEARNSKLILNNPGNKYHYGYLKEDVGYGALHEWIRKYKIKTGCCEICENKQSGYKDRDFDLANISGEYKRDIEDFAWLCQICHKLFDRIKKNSVYHIIGIECKSTGYLTPEEKDKLKWYHNKRIFGRIFIARKGFKKGENKRAIILKEFEDE